MSQGDCTSNSQYKDISMADTAQREPNFEQHVIQTLHNLQQQVDLVNQGLGNVFGTLPTTVREAVQAEVHRLEKSDDQVATPTSRMATNSRQLNAMLAQIDELTAKNKSLEELRLNQEWTITNLNADLSKKSREARKLHEIIIQSGQEQSAVSDDDITNDFVALNYDILRIVKKHFAASTGKTKWKQYNALKADERDFWVRALVADEIFAKLFHPNQRLFGIDCVREEHQVEFEEKLYERKVPEAEIVDWRMQTVKVAKTMSMKKRRYRRDRLSDDLCDELKDIRISADPGAWKLAKEDMDSLCESAFDLALKIRGCRARYEWQQDAAPASIPASDVDIIGTLNLHTPPPLPRVGRMLFGPVYKSTEGESILLRKGEVLNSN